MYELMSRFAHVRINYQDQTPSITKKYILKNSSDAEELAIKIKKYYDKLIKCNLNVAEIIDIHSKKNIVILIQTYLGNDTHEYIIKKTINTQNIDNILLQCTKTFDDFYNILKTIPLIGRKGENLLDGPRYLIGYDWQPANIIKYNNNLWLFDLVYPLEISEITNLPDMNLRRRNYDEFPPELAYYIWHHPIGILHNISLSIKDILKTNFKKYSEIKVKLHNLLLLKTSAAFKDLGFESKFANLISINYNEIMNLLNDTGKINYDDLLKITE